MVDKEESRVWFRGNPNAQNKWRKLPETIRKRDDPEVVRRLIEERGQPDGMLNGFPLWKADAFTAGISKQDVGGLDIDYGGHDMGLGLRSGSSGDGSSGDGGGGDISEEGQERLDEMLGHVGGYDSDTNSAADPVSSGSKGFDPEDAYDDLNSHQQDRLTDKNGSFNEDGTVESDNVTDSTQDVIADNNAEDAAGLPNDADNSDPSTMTSPSSDDLDSSNSPASTPVPDEITDALPDGVSPGMAAVGLAAAVYFGVIR